MAQYVEFAPLPNTQSIAYAQELVAIFGEVGRASPSFKSFRQFLRTRNLYDKETWPTLSLMLQLQESGGKMVMGSFGRDVLAAEDEAGIRVVMARHLIQMNPLIAKYCLEALDTERGGRLHSTNEFYRILTSFVYPGEKPTLVNFRAWVEWAVGAGLLKLVGVRWAMGEVGLRELPNVRQIDPDEFLEEEAEEAEEVAQVLAEEEVFQEVPTESEAIPEAPELFPPVVQPDVAPVEVPSAPPPSPPPAPRSSRPAVPSIESADVRLKDLDSMRDQLVSWHTQYRGRCVISSSMIGVDPKKKTPVMTLEMAFGALLLSRGIQDVTARMVLDGLRESGQLLHMARGKFPAEGLATLMARGDTPEQIFAFEACIHLPRIFKITSDSAPLVSGDDPREFLWGLYRRLYEPVAPLAPFYLARFLWERETLPESLTTAAFVPTLSVRTNAFRIGFSDRMHCPSFAELMELSLMLVERFPAPGFEGPLNQVHEGYGCSFWCDKISSCPLPCREKKDIGRRRLD